MTQQAQQIYLKAREHWTAGQTDEAQAAYRWAISLDPNLPHPHFDLATLLEAVGGDPAETLDHYQRFVALAADNPKLASQVNQARQRIEALRVSPRPPLTPPQPSSPRVSSAAVHVKTPPPAAGRPAAGILTTEVLVSKMEATRIVKKGLEGTLLKKERIEEHAPKAQLPLWRVHCKVRKGLLGRQQVDEYLYFSAHNGKLLTLDRKELRFTDIVDIKAHRVADLDGTARFTRRPLNQLTSGAITPKVGKEVIEEKAREMFGVEVVYAELLLFPVWQFTVAHKQTGDKRQVLIDTTFGRQVT